MKRIILITTSLFISLNTVNSQGSSYSLDPKKQISQYICENWTTKDNLPSNSLLHLCQSKDGYIWISSYQGLIRFDGINFKVFNKKNINLFENDIIREIAVDQDGVLWITTQASGFLSYREGTFTNHGRELGIKHLYRALFIDSKNQIWSASPDKGWFYYDRKAFHFLESTTPLTNIEVRTIAESKNGIMWFGTLGKGLYRYENGTFTIFTTADGLPNNNIYSLYVDNQNGLWIGTGNGLCYFDGKTFSISSIKNPETITSITKDKHNNLWFGSTNGLYRKKADTGDFEYLSSNNGLTHDFIVDMLFDVEENLWMTNYKGGLSKLKDGKFTVYTENSGLAGKVVNAICEYEPNSFLVAFDNGGLSKIVNEKIVPYQIRNLSDIRIRHILKDSQNNIWISTYSGLLKIKSDKTEEWLNENTGFPATQIRLSFEDSKRNIWIGTRNNGLIKISKDKPYQVINTSNGLSSNLIMSIDETKDGDILVGTSEGTSGLHIVRNDKVVKIFGEKDGLFSEVIFNTYVDNDGYTWIATNGSLYCYHNNELFNISSRQGLIDDSPYDIVEDNIGFLWMPYSRGIMRVKKQNLIDYVHQLTDTIICQNFNKYDGMKVSECNPTTQSIKASDGSLLFPTIDGVAKVYPDRIPKNEFIPPVIIEDFIVDNTSYSQVSKPIASGKKRFTFIYTAINLYEPAKIQFKYKLDGFDNDWINAGTNRSVSYTNLHHGKYKFNVIACNNDGVWNETGTSISFSIKSKFIQTIWFYLLCLLVIFLISLGIYRTRILTLKRRQIILENTINERTKELIEVNNVLENQAIEIQQKNIDLIAQKEEIQAQAERLEIQRQELNTSNMLKDKIFSVIAHDLRNSLGNFSSTLEIINSPLEIDPFEKKEMLNLLSDVSKSTYHLLENLLNWSLAQRGVIDYYPVRFTIKPLLTDVIIQAKPFSEKKSITITDLVDDNFELMADMNMTRMIFRNLIGNAIKFTPRGGEIKIFSKHLDNFIEFGVQDNGVGMNEEKTARIFSQFDVKTTFGTDNEQGSGLGLMLCKDFIEKNEGSIRVESREGVGTTFFFTLKAT